MYMYAQIDYLLECGCLETILSNYVALYKSSLFQQGYTVCYNFPFSSDTNIHMHTWPHFHVFLSCSTFTLLFSILY